MSTASRGCAAARGTHWGPDSGRGISVQIPSASKTDGYTAHAEAANDDSLEGDLVKGG